MNEAGPEPERDQERELEALIELSRRGRAKLERLHEVLTTPGHYGTGATPAAVVYRENKLPRIAKRLKSKRATRRGLLELLKRATGLHASLTNLELLRFRLKKKKENFGSHYRCRASSPNCKNLA